MTVYPSVRHGGRHTAGNGPEKFGYENWSLSVEALGQEDDILTSYYDALKNADAEE